MRYRSQSVAYWYFALAMVLFGLQLAFGRQTWPHRLVRAMLAEQLYRATTILAGHPYHRA